MPAVTEPRVTVVIATHDRPDAAERALRSALGQTAADLEVVVVDDASDPPFRPVTDDPRVRVVRRDVGGGMCAARNDGLGIARGEWITFLDDDDELEPRMVERALGAVAESTLPAPVAVMTGMTFVGPDGEELERCHPPSLPRGSHYLLEDRGDLRSKNTLVMPTEVVRSIGGWDEQLESFEADDFGIRLNQVASILGIEDPLYRMTQHGGPRLTSRLPAISRDMKRTVAKHRAVFRRHRARYAHYQSTIGVYDLRSGRWASAVWWCLRGVVHDPRRARLWRYLAAALAGPWVLAGYRRLRPRGVDVSTSTLMRRRARKYAKRLGRQPRAVLAAPLAALADAVVRWRVLREPVDRPRAVLVCGVYRAANAATVAALLERPLALGWEVRLWALDAVAPALAAHTVGSGPGSKFPLLNEIVRGRDLARFEWVVVTDDDLAFPHWSVAEVLAVAEQAELDLVQPAHVAGSHHDHAISARRLTATARRTTFVEIGPLFAVRRPWVDRVVPFAADQSMGWGIELDWFDLERDGARLGIVDAVPVRHLAPVGRGYETREHYARLRQQLADRAFDSFGDIQQVRAVWRLGDPSPRW